MPDLRRYTVLFLMVAVLFASGCEPLRKKFVRKKKADQENQTVVILDPEDYAEKARDPLEGYTKHYQLWKVWVGELSLAVEDKRGDKKVSSTILRVQEQLKAMKKFLSEENQSVIDAYADDLNTISEEYEKPEQARNRVKISSLLRSHAREIKSHFAPGKVKLSRPAL